MSLVENNILLNKIRQSNTSLKPQLHKKNALTINNRTHNISYKIVQEFFEFCCVL